MPAGLSSRWWLSPSRPCLPVSSLRPASSRARERQRPAAPKHVKGKKRTKRPRTCRRNREVQGETRRERQRFCLSLRLSVPAFLLGKPTHEPPKTTPRATATRRKSWDFRRRPHAAACGPSALQRPPWLHSAEPSRAQPTPCSGAAGRPEPPLPHVLQRKRRPLPLPLPCPPLPRPRATSLPIHAAAASRAAGGAAAARPAATAASARRATREVKL